MAALDHDLRAAVSARYFAELETKEIAAMEGVSQVTIRKRLRRGLRALETIIKGTDS